LAAAASDVETDPAISMTNGAAIAAELTSMNFLLVKFELSVVITPSLVFIRLIVEFVINI